MFATTFLPLADIAYLNLVALWVLTELCVAAWILLIVRRLRRPRGLMASRLGEAPWGLVDVWLIMLTWFVSASMVTAFGSRIGNSSVVVSVLGGTVSLVATGIGLAWLAARYRTRMIRWIRPANWAREIWIGIVAFIAVVPPIFWLMGLLVRFLPYHHETLEQIKAHPSMGVVLASYFAAALAAPIGEEFFFRLVLQSWLQRLRFPHSRAHRQACVYGDLRSDDSIPNPEINPNPSSLSAEPPQVGWLRYWPIIASAAMFAALHIGQGPAPIALFLLGLALGYLYLKSGSILACIVLHACMNFYSLTWETLAALEIARGGVS